MERCGGHRERERALQGEAQRLRDKVLQRFRPPFLENKLLKQPQSSRCGHADQGRLCQI